MLKVSTYLQYDSSLTHSTKRSYTSDTMSIVEYSSGVLAHLQAISLGPRKYVSNHIVGNSGHQKR